MRLWIACLLLWCAVAEANTTAASQRSVMLTMGKPSGFMLREVEADGAIKVHYEFNDRGRGPALDARYRLDDAGLPLEITISGNDYLKSKVDEQFRLTEQDASWRNAAEQETRAGARGFYLSLDGTPEESAMLVRAALAAGGRIDLLPAGQATVRVVADETITAKGKRTKIQLYAIEGLDMTPGLIWLDQDQQFFASWSPWFSLIREGFEFSQEVLGSRQRKEEQRLATQRARALTEWLRKPLLIENARVYDPHTKAVLDGQSVFIDRGRIVAVGPSIEVRADTDRLDAEGRFLMAGMWDMHVHIGAGVDGLLHLMSGVTTVRDMANDEAALDRLEAAIDDGKDLGPRILRAGFVDGRGPYAGPTKVFADTVEEGLAAVDAYADSGYRQIKVYSSLKPELVAPMAARAKERGLRFSGHVPQGMNAEAFIAAGADEVQHTNFLFLNFLAGPTVDTRTPQRFTTVADGAKDVPLSGSPMRRLIALMKERGTVVDPTLMTFEGMFLDRPGRMGPTFASTVNRLPLAWQRGVRAATGGLPTTPANDLNYRLSYQRMIDLVGVLHREGVQIVAGTDATPVWALVRELELYVAAGISPVDALRIATLDAARVMGLDQEYGSVEAGKVADLILVDGDPSLSIGDLRRVQRVIRGDRMHDAAALRREVGIANE